MTERAPVVRPGIATRRLVRTTRLGAFLAAALVVLAACSSAGPTPGSSAAGADALDCTTEGYACSWAQVDPAVRDRSVALAHEAAIALGSGGWEAAAESVRGAENVAELLVDTEAIRFRLDGGRPVWILDRGDGSGSADVSPAAPAAWTGPGSAKAVFDIVPAREAPRADAAVVGSNPESKSAIVLAPFAWTEDMGAGSIADLLAGTRGYAGNVEYYENASATDTTVSVDTLGLLGGHDVIYLRTFGGKVCPEGEQCHAVLAIQELNDPDYHLPENQESSLDIIVWKNGTESIGVSADFFRQLYPGGLPNALIFLDAPQYWDTDHIRAIKAPSSELYYWDRQTFKDTRAVLEAYIGNLSSTGRSPEVVFAEMADQLIAGDAKLVAVKPIHEGALRIREVVRLSDDAGNVLGNGSPVIVDGTIGDGQPDTIHVGVEVDGIPDDETADTSITLSVDGQQQAAKTPLDGIGIGDDRWAVTWDVEMPDLEEGQSIQLDAVATLYEGGTSQASVTVGATGVPDLGLVWEGDASTTANTAFPGVTITTSAHAVFTRDPEWEPGDSRVSYFLTGGSFSWTIGGTSGSCTFEAGPIQVPLGVDDHSYISFDLKRLDEGVIGYYGMANVVDGRRVEVAKTCGGKSENYNTTAGGPWFLAPEDGEFVLEGTVAEGKWASGAVIHTDFSWRFAKSE